MVVYWCERIGPFYTDSGEPYYEMDPHVEEFPDGEDQIAKLLNTCDALRKAGKFFVTSTSHHCTGVSGIIDGKLPDGTTYQWRKRRPY